MESDYLTRKAHLDDVKAMHGLLLACAQKGLLLPRALIYLYGHIRNFFVVEAPDGEIVACCALAPVWEDLGEICSWWCATICAVRAWGGGWSRPASVSAVNCI